MTNETDLATKAALENLRTHLVYELDACGFLRNLPKRPVMVRNLRHVFQRGEVTEFAIGRHARGRKEEAEAL